MRFSIRLMLLLVAVLSVVLCWCATPSVRAHRFATAVRSGNSQLVQAMFTDPGDKRFHRQMLNFQNSTVEPITMEQILNGTRNVRINMGMKTSGASYKVTFSEVKPLSTFW